ncbi:MAG: hypothetical protein KDK08_28845 [Rhizobiaceae bacterium]|nr:hypothetical protein [Rhizobiaceae bacterium]
MTFVVPKTDRGVDLVFVGRKFESLGPWEEPGDGFDDEVPIEAAQYELRAAGNALSVWLAPEDNPKRHLGLAIAATRRNLNGFGVAWVRLEELHNLGVSWTITPPQGQRIPYLQKRHVDLLRLDAFRWAKVASAFGTAVKSGNSEIFSKDDLVKILREESEKKWFPGFHGWPKEIRDDLGL